MSWTSEPRDDIAVTGYKIFYQGNNGGKGFINAENTASDAIIMELVVGATYSVTIVANSNLLTSEESNEVSITLGTPFK